MKKETATWQPIRTSTEYKELKVTVIPASEATSIAELDAEAVKEKIKANQEFYSKTSNSIGTFSSKNKGKK